MQHKTIIGETVEIKSFGEIYRKLLTTSKPFFMNKNNQTFKKTLETSRII